MTKVKSETSWDGYYFQVTLDGKKYPRERSDWYVISRGFEPKQAKEEAVEFAKWERAGKYISSAGVKYQSEEQYEKFIEEEMS